MVVHDTIFDLIVFTFLFASPFLDRWLVGFHSSLKGVSTALLMALLSYLSMWEIFRRSPLRRFRSQESLATALAASTVGLVFCLLRNQDALVILVLSIGFMMGALVAAISVIGCILDWKLERGEWWFVGAWATFTAAAAAYLGLMRSMPSQAALLSEASLAALCAILFAMDPRRIFPLLSLVTTVMVSVAWGFLCSQVVMIGTRPGPPYMMIISLVGFAGWALYRMALGTTPPPANETGDGAVPSIVWLGPIGLVLHNVFETRRVAAPPPPPVDTLDPNLPPEALPSSNPPTPPATVAEQQPFGIIFPGRLTERLVLPVLLSTILNQLLQ